jgi:hypothetical protein
VTLLAEDIPTDGSTPHHTGHSTPLDWWRL